MKFSISFGGGGAAYGKMLASGLNYQHSLYKQNESESESQAIELPSYVYPVAPHFDCSGRYCNKVTHVGFTQAQRLTCGLIGVDKIRHQIFVSYGASNYDQRN